MIIGTPNFPSHGDALLYYAEQYQCSMVDVSYTVKMKLEDDEIHIGEPKLRSGEMLELRPDGGGSRRYFVRTPNV